MTGLFFRSLRRIVLLGSVVAFGTSAVSARAENGCYAYYGAPAVRYYSPQFYCEPARACDGYASYGYDLVYASGSAYRQHFPAVGMAVYATQAKRVTDEMFIEAAHAVADQVSAEQLKLGMLFPPQSNLLETEIRTAARVAQLVFERSLAGVERPDDCEAFFRSHLYKPEYRKLV
jgi:Malic enzyme, NAD binding domain